uniref:PH domain-containing protein n=1 Tax=Arcella intermedia TaxID=1963864 RepID=A0A6B2LAX3_9EUKA
MKAIKILYMGGFTTEEEMLWKDAIKNHIINGFRELLIYAESKKVDLGKLGGQVDLFKNKGSISNEDEEFLVAVWPLLQPVLKTSVLVTYENLDYFVERLHEILQTDYIPSGNDILRARQRTAGFSRVQIEVNERDFLFIDCGGQVAEREKWHIIAAESVSCLYLTALSNYDTPLHNDQSKTLLDESIEVWADVVNSNDFRHCGLILLLNKSDVFTEKLKTGSFREKFPKFKGDETLERCAKYITKLFESKLPKNRQIYPHIICAVDTEMMRKIFVDISAHICQSVLVKNGMM